MSWKCAKCGKAGSPNSKGVIGFTLLSECPYCRTFKKILDILPKPHITQCQHCYCGKIDANGQPHWVCCMCGHRTLVNSITY